ncbi:histidine phosphotransferase family protein [Sphingomonas nostoxanthinifaciens]|uniref:histidine phosphotransferase family protein n=1 Tax=Sphingomonas nostoxanthinifaciens TaxID=2872652 RepID=UPI001CC201E3|nr:histidine phosphotransferase family protein [Sphingomonas nostoxanthinifaciens]UAK26095.1 histidine phosphotransferase [Sphingomonas nostoxanthinifaciens]
MTDTVLDFASLLCSRLCHDLLSPVGAMSNGLELLVDEDDPNMRARCMELLQDSARAAADRLKFFRLAFGAAGGFGDEVATAEVRDVLAGLVRGNARVELGWMVEQPMIGKSAAKVLLNLAMVAFDALVRGGRLDIGAEAGEVVVRAEGPRLVLDAEIRGVLSGAGDPQTISSRTSAAWLVMKLARDAGGQITLSDDEAGVLLLGATMPEHVAG